MTVQEKTTAWMQECMGVWKALSGWKGNRLEAIGD
jgi:hypothetical protein